MSERSPEAGFSLVEVAVALRRGGHVDASVAAQPGVALPVRAVDSLHSRFYLRLDVAEETGVLGRVATVFGRHDVSVESVIQHGRDEDPVRLVFVTHHCREADLRRALAEIARFDCVRAVASVIRVID